jgi:Fe-S-cluster-containing dehydrogenase component/CRP-like cAMP-binding protein
MSEPTATISRPQRWDVPFDNKMDAAVVDRLLGIAPFSRIDPANFPQSTPLRDILLNDTSLRSFRRGELIVREGDYGNSAFFIISGSVKVTLGKDAIPAALLGRHVSHQKSPWETFRQLWQNPAYPEVRDTHRYASARAAKTSANTPPPPSENSRGLFTRKPTGKETSVFLSDIPSVLKGGTVSLAPGMFFGEIAALGRTPRTATIFADEPSVLLEIRWQGLRELRLRAPEIKQFVDTNYRKYSLENHLRETEYFKDLSPAELKLVADQTRFETYGGFDWHTDYKKHKDTDPVERLRSEPVIAEQGQYANGLILIRAGFARLSQTYNHGQRTISYLARGQMFGFEEIAHNWRSNASVPFRHTLRALGYVDVLVIPSQVIEQYILPKIPPAALPPPIPSQTEVDTLPAPQAQAKGKLPTDFVEFLVDNRFINGRAAMLIDLERCTRCDDCVRACAAGHDNNPRFIRHGPQLGSYLVATACMHCLDPVCMIGCPTGAISRDSAGGQVVINDITCIGCSTCANSCPYNNIQMVEIRDARGHPLLDHDKKPVTKAAKCDLCLEQPAGPACIRACPHDALARLNVRDTDTLAAWLQR